MRCIEIFRLRRVRDKPRALAVMQTAAGVSEAAAWAALHEALGGGRPTLALPDDQAARDCIVALSRCGFVARFKPGDGEDPCAQAEAVMLPLIARMPAALADAAGAELLAGRWADALQLCLQYWRTHAAPGAAERAALERVRIELGVDVGSTGRQ